MGRGYCVLGVWLYCSGGRGYWYWGVASKHCGRGLVMGRGYCVLGRMFVVLGAWLKCIVGGA